MSRGEAPAAREILDPEEHAVSEETPFLGEAISQPPSARETTADRVFRGATLAVAWFTVILVFWIVFSIGRQALPSVRSYGLAFLGGGVWDANRKTFGILPAIVGTLYSSVLGLIIGTLFGLAIAIFLSEGFLASGIDNILKFLRLSENPWLGSLPKRVENLLKITVELLAAIPSVVYGLWGIFVVIPFIRPAAEWLHIHLGWIPIFGTGLSGPGTGAGRAGSGDHGTADYYRDLARRAGGRAAEVARGRFRNGCNSLGGDSGDLRADSSHRNFRRGDSWIRQSLGRDDGAGHARGQF